VEFGHLVEPVGGARPGPEHPLRLQTPDRGARGRGGGLGRGGRRDQLEATALEAEQAQQRRGQSEADGEHQDVVATGRRRDAGLPAGQRAPGPRADTRRLGREAEQHAAGAGAVDPVRQREAAAEPARPGRDRHPPLGGLRVHGGDERRLARTQAREGHVGGVENLEHAPLGAKGRARWQGNQPRLAAPVEAAEDVELLARTRIAGERDQFGLTPLGVRGGNLRRRHRYSLMR
jgi:hypothetical protein